MNTSRTLRTLRAAPVLPAADLTADPGDTPGSPVPAGAVLARRGCVHRCCIGHFGCTWASSFEPRSGRAGALSMEMGGDTPPSPPGEPFTGSRVGLAAEAETLTSSGWFCLPLTALFSAEEYQDALGMAPEDLGVERREASSPEAGVRSLVRGASPMLT